MTVHTNLQIVTAKACKSELEVPYVSKRWYGIFNFNSHLENFSHACGLWYLCLIVCLDYFIFVYCKSITISYKVEYYVLRERHVANCIISKTKKKSRTFRKASQIQYTV